MNPTIYLIVQMLLCLLVAFLLGLLVGWWLGRRKPEDQADDGATSDLDRCHEQLAESRSDLEECRSRLEECLARGDDDETAAAPVALATLGRGDSGVEAASGTVAGAVGDDAGAAEDNAEAEDDAKTPEETAGVDAGAGGASAVAFVDTAALDESPASDDLKIIEGIGPKIEGLLNADGISTWAGLAKTEVSVLQAVLDKAGPRYRIHDPGTWPRQAGLAAAGSWDELEALQDRLKGGRED